MNDDTFNDPNWVVFLGKKKVEPGTATAHSMFGTIKDTAYTISLEQLKTDWGKVSHQIQQMIDATVPMGTKHFAMESVEFSLGFTAEGKLAFIAEAGVEATVSVIFKRYAEKTL